MEQSKKRFWTVVDEAIIWSGVFVFCWPVLLLDRFTKNSGKDSATASYGGHLSGLRAPLTCAIVVALAYAVSAAYCLSTMR